jgi:hypothetical protein
MPTRGMQPDGPVLLQLCIPCALRFYHQLVDAFSTHSL